MKTFKALFATASIALALAGQASANVTFRVTGSTAFRAAAMNTMRDMLVGVSYKYDTATLAGSTFALFTGTISGHPEVGTVTIKCHWSGSTDGINQMANNLTGTTYYVDATGATTGAGGASQTAGETETGNAPDMILMDTSQGLTPFQANAITSQSIGVLPFVWVCSKDAPAQLTNMTAQAARQMFATGYLSLSALTGNPADSPVSADGTTAGTGFSVWMYGRDTGSGTRTGTLAETSFGALNPIQQVGPTGTPTVNTTNGSKNLPVTLVDQGTISLNMVGKTITGTGIPASTTITDVTDGTVLVISNNATANGTNVLVTIGNSATFVATGLFSTPGFGANNGGVSGDGGQSSGGSLADQLRWSTDGAADPFGLQANFHYSTHLCAVGYLGLSDADRAVNGTGSGIAAGTSVGCRFLSYEGVSCMGGVPQSLTIGSQAAAATTLTVTTGSTTGIIAGQLVSGTGIAPGTTVVSTTVSTITLSAATTNSTTLSGNVIKAQQFLPNSTRSGQYSFWGYERIGFRAPLGANQQVVKDTFFSQATSSSTDLGAVSGLPDDNNMRVTRPEIGSPISLKF